MLLGDDACFRACRAGGSTRNLIVQGMDADRADVPAGVVEPTFATYLKTFVAQPGRSEGYAMAAGGDQRVFLPRNVASVTGKRPRMAVENDGGGGGDVDKDKDKGKNKNKNDDQTLKEDKDKEKGKRPRSGKGSGSTTTTTTTMVARGGDSYGRGKDQDQDQDQHELEDLEAAENRVRDEVRVWNGLECKIGCSTYKMSYVLDTEDVLYRRTKRRRTGQEGVAASAKARSIRSDLFQKWVVKRTEEVEAEAAARAAEAAARPPAEERKGKGVPNLNADEGAAALLGNLKEEEEEEGGGMGVEGGAAG